MLIQKIICYLSLYSQILLLKRCSINLESTSQMLYEHWKQRASEVTQLTKVTSLCLRASEQQNVCQFHLGCKHDNNSLFYLQLLEFSYFSHKENLIAVLVQIVPVSFQ